MILSLAHEYTEENATSCLYAATHAVMPQFASMQPDYSIHFLQLTGPEAELQAAAEADPGQLGLNAGGARVAAAPDLAFLQMLKGMPDCSNFTYDAFVAGVLRVAEGWHVAWTACFTPS